MELQLSLLGKLQIHQDGNPVSGFVSSKAQALLCYLAVTARPHTRSALATLLWDDMPDAEARTNLRAILANLRKLIGPHLDISREEISFNRNSPYWLDTELFETSLAIAGLTPHDQLPITNYQLLITNLQPPTSNLQSPSSILNPPSSISPLRQGVELYRGEFLAGFSVRQALPFEEWLLRERERLQDLAMQGLLRLSQELMARGEYAAAIDYTSRLLASEPWREEAHQQMMTLLARSGQRSAALAHYETCRHILAAELGVEPSTETIALYQRLKAVGRPCPHNLPPQATPFVGREIELTQIAAALDNPACRLLTLVGPGGMGKTRLALQAAAHQTQLATFQDGIFLIPLAAVTSPELIVSSLMETLNLPLTGSLEPKLQLLNYLSRKELLLLLDNFEHLLIPSPTQETNNNAAQLLADLLHRAPRLKLLLTSRQRLNLPEEWLLEIEGLTYPQLPTPHDQLPMTNYQLPSPASNLHPPNSPNSPTHPTPQLHSYSALALFIQRARQVQADFTLSEANQTALIRLCHILQGLPLALELAAAWLPILSCAEIVAEIERDLDFLVSSISNTPDRHRSIRAVFESSWNLLAEPEKNALRKLAIFRGGFWTEAAIEVAGASLPILLALLTKSLLRRNAAGRYDMHELLRQFALEKLIQQTGPSGFSQTQAHYCSYYAAFLQQRQPHLKGGNRPETLAEINLELENIRIAWRWAVEHNHLDQIQQMIEPLFHFHETHSRFQEGETAFRQAIQHLTPMTNYQPSNLPTFQPSNLHPPNPQKILGHLLTCQGYLLYSRGLYEQAKTALHQSLAIFRRLSQPDHHAFALYTLGLVAARQGDYPAARKYSQESLALYQSIADQPGMARPLYTLGRIAYNLAEYEAAQYFCQESLAIYRQVNDQKNLADCLNLLGQIACAPPDYTPETHPQAQQRFQENLLIRRAIGDRQGEATALHNLAYIHFKLAQYTQANQHYQASLHISTEIGDLHLMTATYTWLGMTALEQGNYQQARQYLLESLRITDQTAGFARAMDVLCRLADLLQRQGHLEQAIELLTFVQYHPATDDRVHARAATFLAQLTTQLPAPQLAQAQARGKSQHWSHLISKLTTT
jgi:DNA-binding SARP family transcriptional activator/Tfp pilus assembly protein PilF